jgi:hypothetical protein
MNVMVSRSWWVFIPAAVACSYPGFEYTPIDPSSSGAGIGGIAQISGGFGGLGEGGGGVITTSVGGAGVGGGCHVLHLGGGTCEYLPGYACGCDTPGTKCTVTNPQTGEANCDTYQQGPIYGRCGSDADCDKGAWCDLLMGVCKPICSTTADCDDRDGQECIPAETEAGQSIPGLRVCTSQCDPLAPGAVCGPNVNCVALTDTSFDCWVAGAGGKGAPCGSPLDCKPGFLCVDFDDLIRCRPWCGEPDTGSDCAWNEFCVGFTPEYSYDGQELGACVPAF